MTFTTGQKVEWTSQANGNRKTKRGEIVAIVPARSMARLSDFLGEDYQARYKSMVDGGLWGRTHESYLVSVPAKTKRGRPRLYWPRVSVLKVVEER